MKPRSIPPEVAVLCDSPLSFHRALAKPAGGALNALFLSQALYWTKRTNDSDGWFWKTRSEWSDETAMTRSEQETARTALKKSGILEEKLEGLPAKIHFRVNLQKLADLMRQDAASKLATIPPTTRPEPVHQCGQNPASIYAETETTSETTTETRPDDPPIRNTEELTFDDLEPIGRTYGGSAPGPSWCKGFRKQPQILINQGYVVRKSDLMAAAVAGRANHERERGSAPRLLDWFDKALDTEIRRAQTLSSATRTQTVTDLYAGQPKTLEEHRARRRAGNAEMARLMGAAS